MNKASKRHIKQNPKPVGRTVIYEPDDAVSIEVFVGDDTVWLTQQQMAELFGKDRTVIGRRIRGIYRDGLLTQDITCAKFAHMGSDGDQQYEYNVINFRK